MGSSAACVGSRSLEGLAPQVWLWAVWRGVLGSWCAAARMAPSLRPTCSSIACSPVRALRRSLGLASSRQLCSSAAFWMRNPSSRWVEGGSQQGASPMARTQRGGVGVVCAPVVCHPCELGGLSGVHGAPHGVGAGVSSPLVFACVTARRVAGPSAHWSCYVVTAGGQVVARCCQRLGGGGLQCSQRPVRGRRRRSPQRPPQHKWPPPARGPAPSGSQPHDRSACTSTVVAAVGLSVAFVGATLSSIETRVSHGGQVARDGAGDPCAARIGGLRPRQLRYGAGGAAPPDPPFSTTGPVYHSDTGRETPNLHLCHLNVHLVKAAPDEVRRC